MRWRVGLPDRDRQSSVQKTSSRNFTERHVATTVNGNPKIAFVGTGAQGASIGADFALAGHDVTFIEQWPAHVEAIRANGITVNLPARTINAKVPAFHFCQVAEIKDRFDLIFLIVKAYDTKWVTQMVEPVLAKDGFVIGLQNGMTHLDIASVVGADRTIGAVIEIASNMFVPGITNRQNNQDEVLVRTWRGRSWPAASSGRRRQASPMFRPCRGDGGHQVLQVDEACSQCRGADPLGHS